MFIQSSTKTKLDAEIQSALEELGKIQDKTSDDYGTLVDHISTLHKLKTEAGFKPFISPETVIVVAANIFGILRITRYERENVITSKSLGQIMKPR